MLAAGNPVGDITLRGDFARTGHLMVVIGADIVVTVVVDAAFLVVLDMPVGIVFDMRGQVFLAVEIDFLAALRILKAQLIKALALVGFSLESCAGFFCR
ncbi:hypothetical protein Xkoz_03857 [Xenorhabdus kozodoii]|uniref:Uncharacterized protein n=1 Tax=Xenorhabdus kozodoii TaxID=351676 RepID=A0A2D0KP21_9GAMM|nr:hypothetical protein Xkoz_03857 [Xenorhabdus kozodoii]